MELLSSYDSISTKGLDFILVLFFILSVHLFLSDIPSFHKWTQLGFQLYHRQGTACTTHGFHNRSQAGP
jgi:hypothetical protein